MAGGDELPRLESADVLVVRRDDRVTRPELQTVRDEAHRFAQHYHHVLRRKKTLDELAMLDDQFWQEEQERAREAASQRSAQSAHDEIHGTRRKKRSLLSRILPFGLLRGTFRSGGRSDYL